MNVKLCGRLRQARYRKKHPERIKAGNATPAAREARRRYAAEHPEAVLKVNRAYSKRHPYRMAAKAARQRALKLLQCPSWVNQARIREIYFDAQLFSEAFNIDYHVDHIYPLSKGGLHVPWNLQIIPASMNLSKGSKLPE